jgi:AcrR family transcriptional regulator
MPNSKLTEEEKLRKQNYILDVAEKVFFEKSYEETTMIEIAKKAKLAKGTLYLYFPSKLDLYYALVTRSLKLIEEVIDENLKNCKNGFEKVVAMGKSYVEFARRYPENYTVIMTYESHSIARDMTHSLVNQTYQNSRKIFDSLVSWVYEGIKDNSIKKGLDPIKLATVLWTQTTGMVQQVKLRKRLFEEWSKVEPQEILDYYILMTQELLKP